MQGISIGWDKGFCGSSWLGWSRMLGEEAGTLGCKRLFWMRTLKQATVDAGMRKMEGAQDKAGEGFGVRLWCHLFQPQDKDFELGSKGSGVTGAGFVW